LVQVRIHIVSDHDPSGWTCNGACCNVSCGYGSVDGGGLSESANGSVDEVG